MENSTKPIWHFLFLFLIFSAFSQQGFSSSTGVEVPKMVSDFTSTHQKLPFQGEKQMGRNWRRLMIGSTAPTCTYNECRGCKYKCRAEQIPVEGNDPINSAYHYRCVCHG